LKCKVYNVIKLSTCYALLVNFVIIVKVVASSITDTADCQAVLFMYFRKK